MTVAASNSALGRALVDLTKPLYGPTDCPGRRRANNLCEQHGEYHNVAFYRHCDNAGYLIHLNVSAVLVELYDTIVNSV